MSAYINCNNSGLTWKSLFNLLAKVSADGCAAMNTVESAPCEAPVEEAWEWDNFTDLQWDDNSIVGID